MAMRAKPDDIQRTLIIRMVRFGLIFSAFCAWLTLKFPSAKRVLHRRASAIFDSLFGSLAHLFAAIRVAFTAIVAIRDTLCLSTSRARIGWQKSRGASAPIALILALAWTAVMPNTFGRSVSALFTNKWAGFRHEIAASIATGLRGICCAANVSVRQIHSTSNLSEVN